MARSKLKEAHEILENAERGGDASFVASHLLGWARLVQEHLERPKRKKPRPKDGR